MNLRTLILEAEPDNKVWIALVHSKDSFAVVLVDGVPPVGPLAWGPWHTPSTNGHPFNLQDEAVRALKRRLVNGMPDDLLNASVVTMVQFLAPAEEMS